LPHVVYIMHASRCVGAQRSTALRRLLIGAYSDRCF